MTSDDDLRNTASRILAKRLEAKMLMLTCGRCQEYFQAARWQPYCNECQEARRAT
jgi:Zn finger protein HypA/HybF involved in hydrogenase expression